jgi:hypothetical protein
MDRNIWEVEVPVDGLDQIVGPINESERDKNEENPWETHQIMVRVQVLVQLDQDLVLLP